MIKALVIAALLVTGCDGGDEPDPLAGTAWASPIEGYSCEMGFSFGHARDYTFVFGCILGSGETAAIIETGDYDTDTRAIYMTARRSSCPREEVTINTTANYTRGSNTLSLLSPDGTFVSTFARLPPGGDPNPGSFLIGCFDSELYFTPRPVTTL